MTRSTGLIPAATTSTTSWPAAAVGSANSPTTGGSPNAWRTAAFMRLGSRLLGDDGVLDRPDALDLHPDDVAGDEEAGRLERLPDPAAGAGGDHVAGLQGDDLGQLLDQLVAVEDQVLGVRVLAHLAVDDAFQVERMRVDLVGGDQVGAERPVGVERLAEGPLRRLFLVVADRQIVDGDVARDDLRGVLALDVFAGPADDDAEL